MGAQKPYKYYNPQQRDLYLSICLLYHIPANAKCPKPIKPKKIKKKCLQNVSALSFNSQPF